MTPDVKSKPAKPRKTLSKAELDDQLDEALEETFPASDPVTVGDVSDETPERPETRQAPRSTRRWLKNWPVMSSRRK